MDFDVTFSGGPRAGETVAWDGLDKHVTRDGHYYTLTPIRDTMGRVTKRYLVYRGKMMPDGSIKEAASET